MVRAVMRKMDASPRQTTVRIWHENLAVSEVGEDDPRPLASLGPDDHLHGGLRLEIAGRLVPCLGFFGPDDVCIGDWLEELAHASLALSAPGGRHVFDEGEQGQPAFVFEREADRAYFSIARSEITDTDGPAGWQRIEFRPEDFVTAHREFLARLLEYLRQVGPEAEAWAREHVRP